ncbi:MAG: PD40 domain-containing protein [Nitriliruptoraceae bacterium]|nr:PD40 domain-containing protein [Nitriliruptoraceae bacterium]
MLTLPLLLVTSVGGVLEPAAADEASEPAELHHVVVIDGLMASVAADRGLGDVLQSYGNDQIITVRGQAGDRSGSVTFPRDLTVGRHGTEVLDRGFSVHLADDRACAPRTLSLDVEEFEARGEQPRISAAFEIECVEPGMRVAGLVRFGTAVPVEAVAAPPVRPQPRTLVGAPEVRREVVVRNLGAEAVTLPAAAIGTVVQPLTGGVAPGAADWRVVADGCQAAPLARGGSCSVEVGFRPGAAGPRYARLVIDDARLGLRSTVLAGYGRVLPPPPPLDPLAESLGRVAITFGQPVTTDASLTAVVVRRRVADGGTWADLTTLPAPISDRTTHVDATVTPGVRYEYALVSVGEDGRGPQGPSRVATNARSDVLGLVNGETAVGMRAAGQPLDWLAVAGERSRLAVAPSPDGRWVAEARGWRGDADLWKRPAVGSGKPLALTDLPGESIDPAWSPDGRTIAFTNVVAGTRSVWTVPAGGGTPRKVRDGVANPSWDRDGRHLFVEDHRPGSGSLAGLVRLSLTGTLEAVPGGSLGREPAVSPDGRFLAYTVPNSRNETVVVVMNLGREGQGHAWASKQAYTAPSWSVDGRRLVVEVTTDPGTSRRKRGLGTFTVATGSGGDPVLTRQGTDLVSLDVAAPAPRAFGVHLTSAPARTGPAASVGFGVWQAPSGTSVTCSLNGAKAQPCSSPWKGSGLATGRHRLVIEARELSGVRTVTSHVWDVDATAPTVTVTAPPRVTLGDRVGISYRASDASGVASYDVRTRVARSDGAFGDWVLPAGWQGTTATARSVAIVRGREVCVSVRARDTLGNRSAWSAPRCTSRPLDDRSLATSSGWSRGTGSSFLDGTITSTTRAGAELTRGEVRARQVSVIATRCPTCGTADVFIGTTRVGRLDLTAPTTRRQQVIALPVQPAVRTGRLTIRTTSSGRPVAIDGVAVRRS